MRTATRDPGPTSAQERADRAQRRIDLTMRGLERTGDLLLLNVLWIVSCLGVVTVFAGTAAMAGTAWAWSQGDERAPLTAFRQTLLRSGWPSTLLGFTGAIAAAVLGFDAVIVLHMSPPVQQILLVGLGCMAVLLAGAGLWLIPTVTSGRHSVLTAWRTAAQRAVSHPVTTVAGLVLLSAAVTVLLAAPILVLVIPAVAAFGWGSLAGSEIPGSQEA